MKFKIFIFSIHLIASSVLSAGQYHASLQYIFPIPKSKYLSIQTTIILRFNKEHLDKLGNLTDLINVSGSRRANYTGETFFSTDNHTLIFKPDYAFYQDETITVTIKTSRIVEEDYQYTFHTVSSRANEVLTKAVYHHPEDIQIAEPMNSGTSSDIRVINGVAVPSDFPDIHTTVNGETAPGKIFYSTYFTASGTDGYIMAISNDGTPHMYKRFHGMGNLINFARQSDSTFSIFFSEQGYYAVLDSQFNIIDTYRGGHGYQCDEHEFYMLPNGHALMILESHIRMDMSQIVEDGNNNAIVQGNMFQEYDRNKNIIFEWRSWDHFRFEDVDKIRLTASNIDAVHMNAVSPDFDGHYLLSSRHLSELTKINRNTGEIIWRLGGNNNHFDFINDDFKISWQHHIRPVPGKPGHYTLFDNGNKRLPNYSRAVEYKLDILNMTAEKVWEYRFTPDRKSYIMGSVQPLPNGNIFMDWSTKPPVTALEVTSSGEKVFELNSYGHTTYRSHRYNWNANYHTPYFILENFGSHLNLIFNQFGNENILYYKIYRRILPAQTFSILDSTENTWYQAKGLENNTYQNFKVTSVNTEGIESDFSETIQTKINYDQPGVNLIKNGDFSSTINWYLQKNNSANATGTVSSNGYTIDIMEGGLSLTDVKLVQPGLKLTQSQKYSLQFEAFAEIDRYIRPKLQKDEPSQIDYSEIGYIGLTTQKNLYSYTFIMESTSDDNALLVFECGLHDADVTIDNVSLKEITESNITDEHTTSLSIFKLFQNYPNPFNPSTTITYSLDRAGYVELKLFNINGQELTSLVNTEQQSGWHSVLLNGKNLPSGIYLYKLSADNQSQVKKLILLK